MKLKDLPFRTWCVYTSTAGEDHAVCLLSETECVFYSLIISEDSVAYTDDADFVSMLANSPVVDWLEVNNEPECQCTYPANHDKTCSWWEWKQEQRRTG